MEPFFQQVKKASGIEDLLKHSDFVMLHVPLLDATRNLIDARRVAGGGGLIFPRDAIVNEDAVIAGLASKHLRRYVCDFPSNKARGNDRIIALPHLGLLPPKRREETLGVMVSRHYANRWNTAIYPIR